MDNHLNYCGPEAYAKLRNLYWYLRMVRQHDGAARRRYYRRIKSERIRLEKLDFSAEHIRLYCRHMANPAADTPALKRLWAYEQAVVAFGREYSSACNRGPERTVAPRRAEVQVIANT